MKPMHAFVKSVATVSIFTFAAFAANAATLPVSGNIHADKFTAKVVSVDPAKHVVVLEGAEGQNVSIDVPESAKNLSSLKAGDIVDTTVTHSVAVALDTNVDKSAPTASSTKGKSVAAAGSSNPGSEAFRQMNVQLKIKHIDLKNNEVTFEGPKGEQKTVYVENPDIQARLKDLKVNQSLLVTYTDTLNIVVHPAK